MGGTNVIREELTGVSLPELLRTKDEQAPEEGQRDALCEAIVVHPDIKTTLETGQTKMMEWLQTQNTKIPGVRMDLWDKGLKKLKDSPESFCKELLDSEKLKEPEAKGKNDPGIADRLFQWKQIQYPTWVDLTIYACLLEPPLSPPNRSKLRNALAEVLKDSQKKGGSIAKETLPFIDYALMRVKDTNP